MSLRATASQTVGPFFRIGAAWGYRAAIAGPEVAGERVTVEGRLLDGDRRPVDDGLLEIWQADARGHYPHPEDTGETTSTGGFRGFGRVATDPRGGFRITTIKPGRVPGPEGRTQAAHLLVSVFARGLLARLVTRMYFPDDPAHAADPVLLAVPPARRETLVARPRPGGILEWNVILQGDDETVFFDL
jgi:protocatechuate 3,4-dioxygenase, alpha subunit